MSVVQRCPSCGTTSATAGECEACHDAQVRFFCTNHTPGLWLDASTCRACGARFGEAPRPASAPAPAPGRARSSGPVPATPRGPRSPAPARAPASISERPAPPRYSRPPSPRPSVRAPERRERSPWVEEGGYEPGGARLAPWQQILRAFVRARYMPDRAGRYRERPIGRGAGGCLKRLLLTMVLLLVALGSAVFVFGRALLGY